MYNLFYITVKQKSFAQVLKKSVYFMQKNKYIITR